MPETDSSGTPSLPEIQERLREVAGLLRESPAIDPESRQALAGLIDELGTALASGVGPSPEGAHLALTAAHLAESLHQQDQGRLGQVRDRLEQGLLAAEARAPLVSGLIHRLLEALANVGI